MTTTVMCLECLLKVRVRMSRGGKIDYVGVVINFRSSEKMKVKAKWGYKSHLIVNLWIYSYR